MIYNLAHSSIFPLNDEKTHITRRIKEKALNLGFSDCGIARARYLEEEEPHLTNWLSKEYHAGMTYMQNHFEKRLDPRKLLPAAKSVIAVLMNYYPEEIQNPEAPKISKYAYGKDYHFIMKKRLKSLLEYIRTEYEEVHGRVFVDSAPVLEHAWAALSGIGWIGKHSLLINRKIGSFVFLGEVIIDRELVYDEPVKDLCGGCTRCLRACPTGAIEEPYVVNAQKCISYLTIEHKGDFPEEDQTDTHDWIFGCDICQDVCPWNKHIGFTREPEFKPNPGILGMKREEWEKITKESFNQQFKHSPLKRAKFEGIRRNLALHSHKDKHSQGNGD